MMKLPLVSVIIPAYNAERTIVSCLDSVCLQTYSNLEIIVVDDGSTDQTLALLNTYQQDHTGCRLCIFTQKNAGPSVARNHGIAEAKGEFIAFLDADDQWYRDKIESQLKVFYSDEKVALVGGLISIGKQVCNNDKFSLKEIYLRKLLFKNYFMTSSVICKCEILLKTNFNILQKYAEDYRLWLEIAAEGMKCVVLQRYVTVMDDKPLFGASGLSAKLWKMEKGELDNFLCLFRKKKIKALDYWCACTFSLIKFLRRFLISKLR